MLGISPKPVTLTPRAIALGLFKSITPELLTPATTVGTDRSR
jgi:hypothetical protein